MFYKEGSSNRDIAASGSPANSIKNFPHSISSNIVSVDKSPFKRLEEAPGHRRRKLSRWWWILGNPSTLSRVGARSMYVMYSIPYKLIQCVTCSYG